MQLDQLFPGGQDVRAPARHRLQTLVIDQLHQCVPLRWISPVVRRCAAAGRKAMKTQRMTMQTAVINVRWPAVFITVSPMHRGVDGHASNAEYGASDDLVSVGPPRAGQRLLVALIAS
jgi:hypothetical protein